jgi:hypothetical protein
MLLHVRYATPMAAHHAGRMQPVHSPFHLRVGDALSLNAALAIDRIQFSHTRAKLGLFQRAFFLRRPGCRRSWYAARQLLNTKASARRLRHGSPEQYLRSVPALFALAARARFLLACALVGCLGKGPKDRLARTTVYPNRLGCSNNKPQPIRLKGVRVGARLRGSTGNLQLRNGLRY